MPRDIFHSHRTPAPSRFARREPISESCIRALRALRAASTGRLLGPARGRQSGYTEGYPQFQACHGQLVAHGARTRNLRAGTIVGSGTVSNYDRSRGSACIAERRMLEQLEGGAARTPFLAYGDQVRIEMFDPLGRSLFGAIEQRVIRPWR